MSNFDLSSLALASAFPTNKILTDDKGLPSVMVYIPKFKMSDVIDGAGDSTHPAFIVNGVEKDGIYHFQVPERRIQQQSLLSAG